jgi:hypothetical protein
LQAATIPPKLDQQKAGKRHGKEKNVRAGVAILPGMLLKTVYGACDAALAALKEKHRHPTPLYDGNVRDGFQRFGADESDALRIHFRELPAPAAE